MAIPFKNNLDIGQNQLLFAVLQKDSSGPSTPAPAAGQIYYNTQTGRAYYYNGTAWVGMDANDAVMSGADIITAINAALTGTINENKLTVTHPTKTSLGLDQVTNHKQVQAMSGASVDGYVPTWDSTGGDKLKGGYEVVSDLSATLGETAKLATAQGVKSYIGSTVSAVDAMRYKGAIDASSNPAYPSDPKNGDTYKISHSGKIGGPTGQAVEAGDMIIALADKTGATVAADWNVIQANIDGAVIGPASATNGNFAAFGASPTSIVDSGKKAADFAASNHNHNAVYPQVVAANLTASASQLVTHSLGTRDVICKVYQTSSPYSEVMVDIEHTSTSQVTVKFAQAPAANAYRIVIMGVQVTP